MPFQPGSSILAIQANPKRESLPWIEVVAILLYRAAVSRTGA